MQTISFTYALRISKELHAQYEAAGLLFHGYKKARGYDRAGFAKVDVTVDSDTLAENLSKLDGQAIYDLGAHLHSSPIWPAIEKAKGLWLLNRMGEKSDSGYAFGYLEHQPGTWELQEKIAPEVESLLARLKAQGVGQVRIGQELEFGLAEEPVDGFTHWQDVKASVIRQLQFEIAAANEENRGRLEAKLAEVTELNAREILMYDMIELDESTSGILEPLFGRTRDGDGYYDGQNCLELKINHCDASEYSQKQQIVLQTLIRKAKEYGLPLNSPPTSHLNFSFWDEQGNIMHPSHPEYTTKGKVMRIFVNLSNPGIFFINGITYDMRSCH